MILYLYVFIFILLSFIDIFILYKAQAGLKKFFLGSSTYSATRYLTNTTNST